MQRLGMKLGPCVRVGNGARSVCEDLEWGRTLWRVGNEARSVCKDLE